MRINFRITYCCFFVFTGFNYAAVLRKSRKHMRRIEEKKVENEETEPATEDETQAGTSERRARKCVRKGAYASKMQPTVLLNPLPNVPGSEPVKDGGLFLLSNIVVCLVMFDDNTLS